MGNDQADRRRIQYQEMFDAKVDGYLAEWSAFRYIPFVGQALDCAASVTLKVIYHPLFSTDVYTQDQWDDYIQRLKENEKRVDILLGTLFKRTVIDFAITGSMALIDIGLLYSIKNDYNLHNVVFMYACATFLRASACGITLCEKYRISKNDKDNPRLKLIELQPLHDASAETGLEAV